MNDKIVQYATYAAPHGYSEANGFGRDIVLLYTDGTWEKIFQVDTRGYGRIYPDTHNMRNKTREQAIERLKNSCLAGKIQGKFYKEEG